MNFIVKTAVTQEAFQTASICTINYRNGTDLMAQFTKPYLKLYKMALEIYNPMHTWVLNTNPSNNSDYGKTIGSFP